MVKGLGSVGWKSFFVQAAKNYRSMLGMGYAFCELPIINKVMHQDDTKTLRAESCAFFNTHPYFIPLTIGMTARAHQDGLTNEQADGIKQMVMGPFGALGDAFYWATIKPFAAVLGLLLTLLINPLWGIVALLVFFNIFHLPLRLAGAYLGYNLFTKAPKYLDKLKPHLIKALLQVLMGLGLGVLITILLWHYSSFFVNFKPALSVGTGLALGIAGTLQKLPLGLTWILTAIIAILLYLIAL